MAKLLRLSGDELDNDIRLMQDDQNSVEWVSLTDLWTSQGRPWAQRPDLWAKQESNKQLINHVSDRLGYRAWKAIRGGSMQGTFAPPEVAIKYALSLSTKSYDWLYGVLGTMAGEDKARRRTIKLGDISLSVFQLAAGAYRLSQTQVAEAIGKDESSFREFLESKSPEALPYKDFESGKLSVEGSNKPINPIPVPLAIAYWTKEARVGNSIAFRLLAASAVEAIERRADKAFGVQRTEDEYNLRFKNVFEKLVEFFPDYADHLGSAQPAGVENPMVLAERQLLSKMRRQFKSQLFQFPKHRFIRDFVVLASQTDDWHLTYSKGLPYPEGAAHRSAYPDLISQPTEICIDGKDQRVVLLFQGVDSIVDETHIKNCFYIRDYIELVKKELDVDHALLFLVSPYGVTKYAAGCIKDSDDLRGCVGVITVKQLAGFLIEKASLNKKDNIRLGKLRNEFKHLVEYKMLSELDALSKSSIETKSLPSISVEQLKLFSFE